MPQTYQTFRTTQETNSAVRVLTAELTAEMGGDRLTFDEVIHAAIKVASNHRGEMILLLEAR